MKIKFKGQLISASEIKKIGKGFVKYLFVLVFIGCISLYYQTEIFDFKEPISNQDSDLYNPYTTWNKSNVIKANFHAHSKAWMGVTNGHNSDEEITKEYSKLGFEVASISNYHDIVKSEVDSIINIPCFEQGYNTSKAHLLAINAFETSNIDFPLYQGTSQKQVRINRLNKVASLVGIVHPSLRGAFSTEDLKLLKGYQLFEVMSYYAESFDLWDYALKSGNLSWLMANDDTHDLKKQPPGRFFNLVSVTKKDKNNLLNSLKIGNHVAYASSEGAIDIFLNNIKVENNEVFYKFSGNISSTRIVLDGEKYDVNPKGKITLKHGEKYIRFEVSNEKCQLYTNPIFRIQEKEILNANQTISINKIKTINYKLLCLALSFIVFGGIFRKEAFYALKRIIK